MAEKDKDSGTEGREGRKTTPVEVIVRLDTNKSEKKKRRMKKLKQ